MENNLDGAGLYEQMQEVEASSECYSKLTLELLEDFIEELSKGKNSITYIIPQEDLPELNEYNIEIYNEIIDKIKEGYMYSFIDTRIIHHEERQFNISTGFGGAINFINEYKKQRVPANMVYDMIRVDDLDNNISMMLRDVKWVKINLE